MLSLSLDLLNTAHFQGLSLCLLLAFTPAVPLAPSLPTLSDPDFDTGRQSGSEGGPQSLCLHQLSHILAV